jgi:hypothetical protein
MVEWPDPETVERIAKTAATTVTTLVGLTKLRDALARRKKATRPADWEAVNKAKSRECATSAGQTVDTLDRNDPKQEAVYRKCMWPEKSSRGRWRMVGGRIWATIH